MFEDEWIDNIMMSNLKYFFMAEFKHGDITVKFSGTAFKVHNTSGNKFQEVNEDVHFAQRIGYSEDYNSEISLLINFCNKRLAFHPVTNKKYNASIPHLFSSNKSQKPH